MLSSSFYRSTASTAQHSTAQDKPANQVRGEQSTYQQKYVYARRFAPRAAYA